MALRLFALAVMFTITLVGRAADKLVELLLIVPKEPVELDTTAAKKAKEAKTKPVPAAVPVTLRMVNNTDAPFTFNFGADASSYTLTVKGPGVVVREYGFATTREFRLGKPVTLQPGKTFDIPLKELEDGIRGKGRVTAITAPGEYSISATYQASGEENKGPLLKSEAAKFTVVEKK